MGLFAVPGQIEKKLLFKVFFLNLKFLTTHTFTREQKINHASYSLLSR